TARGGDSRAAAACGGHRSAWKPTPRLATHTLWPARASAGETVRWRTRGGRWKPSLHSRATIPIERLPGSRHRGPKHADPALQPPRNFSRDAPAGVHRETLG